MTGLFTAAGQLLADPATLLVAVEDRNAKTPAAALSARDILVTAAGCQASAGTFAYWEWRDLDAAINTAWDRLTPIVGEPGARWADRAGRTTGELLTAFDQARRDGDVKPPPAVTLRPWSRPNVQRTCKVPFVPLAVVLHAWSLDGGTLSELWSRYDLHGATTWELLDRLEPRVAHRPDPGGIAAGAELVRSWMAAKTPAPVLAPTVLFDVALASGPSATLDEFLDWLACTQPDGGAPLD